MKDFTAYLNEIGEVGEIVKVVQMMAWVEGLPGVRLGERVVLETGQEGEVTSLAADLAEVLIVSAQMPKVGVRVARTGEKLKVPVGEAILGKTVDGMGRVIGGDGVKAEGMEWREVDVVPAGITVRHRVSRALETGVILVDLMIPVGRGQRELVMGDRKTGKSMMLLKMVVTQARLGSVCIYAAIGKKKTEIKRVEEYFKKMGVQGNVVLVGAGSHDGAGEIFIAPYTAMTMAEYFRDKGRDVLVVLDDMSTHAKFYREIALVGRRFPGRDSYPGDIFYTHSKLLERAGNFVGDGKETAITCLPVVETTGGDFTGYIQTNMMSMTDGHIYFDLDLYSSGRRPAINPFISVTRVGKQTQSKLRREISQKTLELLNDYEKTQGFLRFGAELSDNSRQIISMGNRVLKFFDQPMDVTVPVNVQTVLWGALWAGVWEGKNMEKLVGAYESDAGLRTMVNNIVINSDSVQTLLASVREKSEQLLGVMA